MGRYRKQVPTDRSRCSKVLQSVLQETECYEQPSGGIHDRELSTVLDLLRAGLVLNYSVNNTIKYLIQC